VSVLYETHRDGIYRFLVGQGLNPSAAQEVTQDVFVDLFVALEKGTEMGSERAWLYAVAGRAAVDHWRREHAAMWSELDATPGATANVPSPESDPESQATHNERLLRLADGLQKLSREHRMCLQLRMRGLRYREIAKILDISTSTAAEWLVSTIDRLRKEANG
jgi:RNA polymerase sigma-70 factor (ECF subfamily)